MKISCILTCLKIWVPLLLLARWWYIFWVCFDRKTRSTELHNIIIFLWLNSRGKRLRKYALKYVFDANLNHRKEVLCKSLPSTSATAVWQKLYLEIVWSFQYDFFIRWFLLVIPLKYKATAYYWCQQFLILYLSYIYWMHTILSKIIMF